MTTDWDVAVVGAGTAGLTAATVAARSGLRVVAYDRMAPGGQLVNLTVLHDFPQPGLVSGASELMAELVAQAAAAGVTMNFAEVTRVHAGAPPRLSTTDGEVTAGAVLVATGLSAGRLGLRGEEELVGRGVSTCAGCDGPLFRDRSVAVVGDDEWTADEALELAGLASTVTVLVPGEPRWSAARAERLAAADRVEVLTSASVVALRGSGVLSGVIVRTAGGERELAVSGLFSYVGRRGPAGLVDGVPADAAGRLHAGSGAPAAVGPVFVAGDARAGAEQSLAAATADGTRAGEAAVAALRPADGGLNLRIIDPTHGVLPEDEGAAAGAPAGTTDWTQVALFSNSKPNATELLQGMGAKLRAHWDLPELGFASKESASVPADGDTIDWLAQRYRMVLVAAGD
ncbi:thioredoxin reductase (NADPH) [Modestobacter sp. DSM 44400]|uniref:NAD(P)/FAD-dependent oxidoreductase n=1 Tax=Modestobacter sp. DSM 44400 TaxID=1550230 RepID=UPI0008972AE7|nr:NAD(P)/FAD-dependent oxidoreductase [Modestobacter sp. DSM 44400]SDX74946.1 thioredoxin reductase (NADPH) [Modestobacter sp. DSM 44400]